MLDSSDVSGQSATPSQKYNLEMHVPSLQGLCSDVHVLITGLGVVGLRVVGGKVLGLVFTGTAGVGVAGPKTKRLNEYLRQIRQQSKIK